MNDVRPTVLIIDDSPEDTETFRVYLRAGFEILTAGRGDRGLALASASRPDCVLLDYQLPDMTALEFFEERGEGHDADYAVIVLTGQADAALAVACMKQGAHDFLTKGHISPDTLQRVVNHSIEKVAMRRQVTAQQQEIEQSRRLFYDLFDFASEAIVMTDREGLIRLMNREAERLFGWSYAEVADRPVEVLMPPSARRQHPTQRKRYLELPTVRYIGASRNAVLLGLRKDGSTFPAEISLNPVQTWRGLMVVASVYDITARHQQDADRLARLAAETSNQAKSSFLANMSHELRTPINGVIGSVDLLIRTLLDPNQRELVDTIRDSSVGLLRVINDILDFSKIEAQQMELERELVSPERLVEAACRALQPLAMRQGRRLRLFTDPRLPEIILGDSLRLRQILNNLLANAIKFCGGRERQGQVSVRSEWREGSAWQITVSDNGIGMTPEVQAKLFCPFVQADVSTTRRFGGTGLGLSIVHRLIELMGGHIEVESAPDQGATFRVTLPLETDTHAAVKPPGSALAGLTCLVIAHDDDQARDWCRYLEHAGARAEPFSERDTATQRLAQLAPESTVVVLDAERAAALHWHRELAIDPAPTLVIIEHGQRRSLRLLNPGLVQLDDAPVTRDALVAAVGVAAGRLAPEANPQRLETMNAGMAPPRRARAIEQGRLILVAEDNVVNQKLICRQLALLGFATDLTDNGQDALMAWRHQTYGLLLTDLQMPEMDGYELALAIRAEEADGQHLPIIALSADVLREAVERCHAVGMDDYLAKPVVLEQLDATLGKWFPPTPASALPPIVPTSTPAAAAALDGRVLADLVGEAPALIADLLLEFWSSAEQCADRVRSAVATADWTAVGRVARELEASCVSIGALPLAECCQRIEAAAKASDGDTLDEWMNGFERRLADVRIEIEKMIPIIPTEAATLDEGVLAALIGDDPELIAELLSDFQVSAEQDMARMRAAVATEDWGTAGAVAHGLKSAALSIGALPFGDCCQRIERAGKTGDGTTILDWMDPFEARLAALLTEISNKMTAVPDMDSVTIRRPAEPDAEK